MSRDTVANHDGSSRGTHRNSPAPARGDTTRGRVSGESIARDVAWRPWHPEEVAARLAGVAARWYVVAGWALDLFRGTQRRVHDDTEIAVPAGEFWLIRDALCAFDFDVVGSGMRWPLESEAFDEHFQTWVREPSSDLYHLDVFRDPHDGDTWICRRDREIRRPFSEVILRNDTGVPFLSPDVVLLFKAKATRDKDEEDFRATLPLLSAAQRAWLDGALAIAHPEHPWRRELS